jgi:PPM family protein phosphatase
VLLETHLHEMLPGDWLMMCSDGLSDMVDDGQIAAVLAGSESLQDAALALVQAANEAGGRDNISVILTSAEGPAPPSRAWWPFRR